MLLFHEHIYFMPKEKKRRARNQTHNETILFIYRKEKKKDPRVQSSLSLETNSTWIAFNFQSGGNIIEP